MNNFTKRILALVLVMMTIGAAYAETLTVSVDGYTTLTYMFYSDRSAGVVPSENVEGEVKIPARVKNKDGIVHTVKYIEQHAFEENDKITSVDLSACTTLEDIDGYAFRNCTALKSVKLPYSLDYIGTYAFSRCSALEEVVFANVAAEQLTIDEFAFFMCGLKTLTLDDKVANGNTIEIYPKAFYDNDNLTKVTVTGKLWEKVFMSCDNLKEITFDAGTTSIGSDIVAECRSLSSVNYNTAHSWNYNYGGTTFSNIKSSSGITLTINAQPSEWPSQKSPFFGSDFKSIIINCSNIPKDFIQNCPYLETVVVGSKVNANSLDNSVFVNCPKMEFWAANSKFSDVKGSLYNSSKTRLISASGRTKTVVLPATVTEVSAGALDLDRHATLDCRALKSAPTIQGKLPELVICSSPLRAALKDKADESGTSFIVPGDLNEDGSVDGSDIVSVVNIVNNAE